MTKNDDILTKIDRLTGLVQNVLQRQDTLENRFISLEHIMKLSEDKLSAKIDLSQKDTIDTLTALIHTGYNMQEKRIKRLEEHTKIAS